ncbi:MAG: lytic transglycosylase domain-containing protein, partial [Caulobacteraceae bacterium]|nr:lytic transglycosylase domain-containing protein [Caulobacteraceae bacterium]
AVSVAELYGNLTANGPATNVASPSGGEQDQGFLQYAGRRGDRQAQEDALVALILRGSQAPNGQSGSSSLAGNMFSAEMLRVLSQSQSQNR